MVCGQSHPSAHGNAWQCALSLIIDLFRRRCNHIEDGWRGANVPRAVYGAKHAPSRPPFPTTRCNTPASNRSCRDAGAFRRGTRSFPPRKKIFPRRNAITSTAEKNISAAERDRFRRGKKYLRRRAVPPPSRQCPLPPNTELKALATSPDTPPPIFPILQIGAACSGTFSDPTVKLTPRRGCNSRWGQPS